MAWNDPTHAQWWRHAVCYQVYVRSFADSDGDGVGDLPGITSRLPYLRDLGVDALWITPFYTSPQHDHGYDVADYCDVDPLFGSLADADDAARPRPRARPAGDRRPRPQPHLRPARVVPGGAGRRPGQPRARALPVPRRRPGRPGHRRRTTGSRSSAAPRGRRPTTASGTSTSSTPPSPTSTGATPRSATCSRTCCASGSTAASTASGSTWRTASSRRRACATRSVAEEEPASRRGPARAAWSSAARGDEPMWDQPEVHDVYRRWHKVLAEYDGDRMAVAEAWTSTPGVDGRLRPPRRAQPGVQLLLAARRPWSAAGVRGGHHRHARRPSSRSAPPRPGCSATTTSSAT